MIEQFKTLLLFILIALSLILTYQLWYGQRPAELIADDVYEQVDLEKPRLLEEAIVPVNIVLNDPNDPDGKIKFLFSKGETVFEQLWKNLSRFLKEIDGDFSLEQSFPAGDALHHLTCYFDPVLPVGENRPWLTGISNTLIENIKFYSIEGSYWLVLNQSEEDAAVILSLNENKSDLFRDLASDLSTDDETAYISLTAELISEFLDREMGITTPLYVPVDEVFMEKLNLSAENLDRDFLLRTFFIDYNLARIIEERDGGLIYTDGEKGLRLTNVSLEYSYPRLEDGQTSFSYHDALFKCSNYISYYGGWPENLRLEKLFLTGRGRSFYYVSEWQVYHEGYPLYTGQSTRAFFNDFGLFHFTRSLFFPEKIDNDTEVQTLIQLEERKPVAGWSEALQEAVEVFMRWSPGTETRLRLEAMNLSYVVTGSKAAPRGVPVWFIRINGENIFLEANTLQFISEEGIL